MSNEPTIATTSLEQRVQATTAAIESILTETQALFIVDPGNTEAVMTPPMSKESAAKIMSLLNPFSQVCSSISLESSRYKPAESKHKSSSEYMRVYIIPNGDRAKILFCDATIAVLNKLFKKENISFEQGVGEVIFTSDTAEHAKHSYDLLLKFFENYGINITLKNNQVFIKEPENSSGKDFTNLLLHASIGITPKKTSPPEKKEQKEKKEKKKTIDEEMLELFLQLQHDYSIHLFPAIKDHRLQTLFLYPTVAKKIHDKINQLKTGYCHESEDINYSLLWTVTDPKVKAQLQADTAKRLKESLAGIGLVIKAVEGSKIICRLQNSKTDINTAKATLERSFSEDRAVDVQVTPDDEIIISSALVANLVKNKTNIFNCEFTHSLDYPGVMLSDPLLQNVDETAEKLRTTFAERGVTVKILESSTEATRSIAIYGPEEVLWEIGDVAKNTDIKDKKAPGDKVGSQWLHLRLTNKFLTCLTQPGTQKDGELYLPLAGANVDQLTNNGPLSQDLRNFLNFLNQNFSPKATFSLRGTRDNPILRIKASEAQLNSLSDNIRYMNIRALKDMNYLKTSIEDKDHVKIVWVLADTPEQTKIKQAENLEKTLKRLWPDHADSIRVVFSNQGLASGDRDKSHMLISGPQEMRNQLLQISVEAENFRSNQAFLPYPFKKLTIPFEPDVTGKFLNTQDHKKVPSVLQSYQEFEDYEQAEAIKKQLEPMAFSVGMTAKVTAVFAKSSTQENQKVIYKVQLVTDPHKDGASPGHTQEILKLSQQMIDRKKTLAQQERKLAMHTLREMGFFADSDSKSKVSPFDPSQLPGVMMGYFDSENTDGENTEAKEKLLSIHST